MLLYAVFSYFDSCPDCHPGWDVYNFVNSECYFQHFFGQMHTSVKSSRNIWTSHCRCTGFYIPFWKGTSHHSLLDLFVAIFLTEWCNCQFKLVKHHINNKLSLRCTMILQLYIHRKLCVGSKAANKPRLHDWHADYPPQLSLSDTETYIYRYEPPWHHSKAIWQFFTGYLPILSP